MPKALGIDLGNAKVKFCLLETTSLDAVPQGFSASWGGGLIPFTAKLLPDRQEDFETGFPAALARFMIAHALAPEDLDVVVVSTSHFFAYPSFEAAHRHTLNLLERCFIPETVRLLGSEGRLYSLAEARKLEGREVVRFAATKFWGSAYLASKLIRDGISIDIGTSSTDLVPIVAGVPDPEAQRDPDAYNLGRLATERFIWYGMTATPLDYISHEAEADGARWLLYPRMAKTEVLTSLLALAPRDLTEAHAYGGRFPSIEASRYQLAQACGLDVALIGEGTLKAIAEDLSRRMVDRIAESIRKVAAHAGIFSLDEAQGAVMGLGRATVAREAMVRAGFRPEHLVDVEDVLGEGLSSVSTAYGAALKGLEAVLGTELSIPEPSLMPST